MHILSKSTYIKGLQCEKALYMQKKHPYLRDKLSIEQRAKFQRGTDVGVLAHAYFPGGVDMSPNSPSQFPRKVQETMTNLANPAVNVMYEAVFQHNDTLIMLDILVRDGDQWMAVEVKSSMRLNDTYYNDAALQYYVLHGCGVPLSDFKLMYLNADYVKNGAIDVKQLFKLESVMEYVVEREDFVAKNVERLKAVVALPHAPVVEIGERCNDPYPCDFYGHCWKHVREPNFYTIDYKTLYSLAPQPKPRSVGYLNLLLHRPAVPEIDGTKPYEEMILAFALQGEHETNDCFVWDCFDDQSHWRDAIPVLIEKLSHYELIVCFTPQNLTTTLLRHEIIQNKEVGHKVFNLFDALQEALFYHPAIKRGMTLQRLAEALFPSVKLFEHSRIILEATAHDLIGYQQAKEDLITENEIVAKTYQHFFK
ncbi:MAG: hypothetical protein IKZ55_11670 [Bacteroidales bacterium]|nr:hypothetical protein [Bacteroidales bacterium]